LLLAYKKRATRPAAATKPGKAVCIGAALSDFVLVADATAELTLEPTPPVDDEGLLSSDEDVDEESPEPPTPPTPPTPPAEATDVKTVEMPVVSVEPSVVRVDSMVEIAD